MKIAVLQMTSVLDPEENLQKIKDLLVQYAEKELKEGTLKALFLPECFYSLSDGRSPTPYPVQEKTDSWWSIRELAREFSVSLLGGSVAYRQGDQITNRALNFSPTGDFLGAYDKIHLFACDLRKLESEKRVDEADLFDSGKELKLITVDEMKLGLNICFDLRFSDQARSYALQGANTLCYPAAFTIPTGKAHWHILNRARAIETQSYVVSSAQWGTHNDRVKTFGHSLVVDPWGEVVMDLGEGEKVGILDLDFNLVADVRKRMKVFHV